jgi:UDP-2,3-diacylglucosamine pyrophosphatase LpxH
MTEFRRRMGELFHKKPDPAPDHYPVVIISDLHLGTRFGASGMLAEFLQHVKCETLILNGDIVDGRIINHRKPKDLPEAQKRVLDAINRKIAEGVEVIYIPGNHDVTLRKLDVAGKKFNGVRIEQSLDFTDKRGRKFLVVHGDQFDRRENRVARLPDWFMGMVGRVDEAMTAASGLIDRFTRATLKKRFQLAKRVRSLVEADKRGHRDMEAAALARVKEQGYDGVICGHSHTAANHVKDGKIYLNSGDWVDSYTALAMNAQGDWQVVSWRARRKELGLKRKFREAANDNPDKGFRPQTEEMLKTIRGVWPGKVKKAKVRKPDPPKAA